MSYYTMKVTVLKQKAKISKSTHIFGVCICRNFIMHYLVLIISFIQCTLIYHKEPDFQIE